MGTMPGCEGRVRRKDDERCKTKPRQQDLNERYSGEKIWGIRDRHLSNIRSPPRGKKQLDLAWIVPRHRTKACSKRA